MRDYVSILLLFFSLSIQSQTVGLILNSEESLNGYTLFSPNNSNTTYLINNCGEIINTWESDYKPGLSVYLLDNGNLLRTKRVIEGSSFTGGGIGGGIEEFNWEGDLIWEYNYADNLVHQHHDIEPLPNGNILILAWEKKSNLEAENMGAINLNTEEIWPEHIIELEKNGNTIVWEWHSWDHIIQDSDINLPNFGNISENPQRININYNKPIYTPNGSLSPNNGNGDWMHANSIDYNDELDQIIISLKRWDEIWIIDHSTTTEEAQNSSGGIYGKGGDLLYRWGNPETYNQGTLNTKKLWGQHDVRWIDKKYPDGGKIMIFNNGSGGRDYSSIDIINPPIDENGNYEINENGIYGPNILDWTFTKDNPYDFYSDHISGSHRLKNGNTMICSGTNGYFFEINPLGDIVWEYINPVSNTGIISQGETILKDQNSVFRCTRYSEDYPAFENQLIETNGFVELNPIDYMCDIYNNINSIEYNNLQEKKLIKKMDILGKQVLNSNNNLIFYIYNDGTVSKKIQF